MVFVKMRSGPVQNLDGRSGPAVQILESGQPCTSIWTKSGPSLDQIWNREKTVWTNFGVVKSHQIYFSAAYRLLFYKSAANG